MHRISPAFDAPDCVLRLEAATAAPSLCVLVGNADAWPRSARTYDSEHRVPCTVNSMRLVVHETPGDAAEAVARRIVNLIAAADDIFTLGLAGGSTPEATYRSLRERDVPWAKVEAWLTDERWVPPDHARSNGNMVSTALLDHVDATFHRPPWSELIEPSDSAAQYEATIRSIHDQRRPDLVLLGMGEDGHTASLFPDTSALMEESRWIVANHVPQLDETRLTATYPLLWSARTVMVLVSGDNKAEALKKTLEGDTPAGRLTEGEGEVEWHIDRAAASLISS